MITIFTHNGEQCAWSIGDSVPEQLIYQGDLSSPSDGISIIAVDGEELSLIHNMFDGLPQHKTEEPQLYTGELAAYIISNTLPYKIETTNLMAFDRDGNGIFAWKVGERRETTDLEEILKTESVICTFKEISWMLAAYKNIPYHKEKNVQMWYGDMARFIVAQLPAKDGQQ